MGLAVKYNSTKDLASINTSLGNLYLDQERYQKASTLFKVALGLHKDMENSKGIAIAHTNLGITYYHLADLDSSISHYRKSIQLKRVLKDTSSLAYSFNGLGKVYLDKAALDSSKYYFLAAYEIRKKLNQQLNKANTSNELGRYFLTVDQPLQAKPFLDEAFAYAKTQDNRTILMESLQLLGKYHKAITAYEEAYQYLERWSAMRDSVFNEEKIKVLELQARFELERSIEETKQAEDQATVANRQKQQAYVLIALACVLLLGTIIFTMIFYRQRKKLSLLTGDLTQKNQQIAALNKQNFHFTRNALSETVSLMNIQINSLKDGAVKETLLSEKLRMEAINLLYQQLFQSPESDQIELSPLLSSIIENTLDVILGFDRKAVTDIRMDDVRMKSQRALTLSMITNEICLNAAKHALKNGGTFTVVLKKVDQEIQLLLKDSGNGYSKKVDKNAFGLRLIDVLTQELDAQLLIDNSEAGLSYYFRIPTVRT